MQATHQESVWNSHPSKRSRIYKELTAQEKWTPKKIPWTEGSSNHITEMKYGDKPPRRYSTALAISGIQAKASASSTMLIVSVYPWPVAGWSWEALEPPESKSMHFETVWISQKAIQSGPLLQESIPGPLTEKDENSSSNKNCLT